MKSNTKTKWTCISNCGSCCKLNPVERSEALSGLTDLQQKEYFKLVGKDGWCIHYDKSTKLCKIYTQRPDFCRVENLLKIFSADQSDYEIQAIKYCRQHIRSIYGGRSTVLKRFNRELIRQS